MPTGRRGGDINGASGAGGAGRHYLFTVPTAIPEWNDSSTRDDDNIVRAIREQEDARNRQEMERQIQVEALQRARMDMEDLAIPILSATTSGTTNVRGSSPSTVTFRERVRAVGLADVMFSGTDRRTYTFDPWVAKPKKEKSILTGKNRKTFLSNLKEIERLETFGRDVDNALSCLQKNAQKVCDIETFNEFYKVLVSGIAYTNVDRKFEVSIINLISQLIELRGYFNYQILMDRTENEKERRLMAIILSFFNKLEMKLDDRYDKKWDEVLNYIRNNHDVRYNIVVDDYVPY